MLYRIYFKQPTSEFNLRCLLPNDKGKTTILAVYSKDTPTSTYTSKQLKWTENTIHDQWIIDITQPPKIFEQKPITSITELLKFGSFREPSLLKKISSFYPGSSFSGIANTQSDESVENKLIRNPEKKFQLICKCLLLNQFKNLKYNLIFPLLKHLETLNL